MILDILLLAGGLALLYIGGDMLIAGCLRVAIHYKISPFIIGATVMGFGTSAPELCVSLMAALKGAPELALGNVLGSNVANIGLVLGFTALIAPLAIQEERLRKEAPPLVIATLLMTLLLWKLNLGRIEGGLMVLGLIWYVVRSLSQKGKDEEPIEDEGKFNWGSGLLPQYLLIAVGLTGLVGGANMMVNGAVSIARSFGISEWLIGITIVAVGTSLPEIISSTMSALKGHGEMAFGNVFGSNIFNILMVLGCTSAVHPLVITEPIHPDLIFVSLFTIFLLVLIRLEHDLSKRDGILLLFGYFLYIGLKSGNVM